MSAVRSRQHPPDSAARGAVVQLVRIPACHAGGVWFESRPLRQLPVEPTERIRAQYKVKARWASAWLLVCAMALAGAYWLWPSGVIDTPFAALTLAQMASALGSALLVLAALAAYAIIF